MKKITFSKTAALAASLSAAGAFAQAIPPPVPPVLLHYEFWQDQYVQWITGDLPYTMIEFDSGTAAGQPKYRVTLTDRKGTRSVFTNKPSLVPDGSKVTEMKVKPADSDGPGAVTELGMIGPDGKPLFWRFVQAVDLTEQGGGLIDMSQSPEPLLLYRVSGAPSAEGTALQVGNTVSPAALWKEVSRPPYLTAYHAARSADVHIGAFYDGDDTWTVTSSPATIAVGSEWKLMHYGAPCTLRVGEVKGPSSTSVLKCLSDPDNQVTLEAEHDANGWLVHQVRYTALSAPKGQDFSLTFAQGLREGGADHGATSKVIAEAGKNKIAEGTLSPDSTGYLLSFNNPGWLKGKGVQLGVSYGQDGVHVAEHLKQ